MSAPKKRARKPRPARGKLIAEGVPFVAVFHENPRLALKCTCTFPDGCDGSRIIVCKGCDPAPGVIDPPCVCEACGAEGFTGCEGCENCNKAECASCGVRAVDVVAIDGETWTCSPECTRKTFTVAHQDEAAEIVSQAMIQMAAHEGSGA